jgi:hypothetical protein
MFLIFYFACLCHEQWQLFIILRKYIFSDTVLASCVDVLFSGVALPAVDTQHVQLVLVILFYG